MDFLTPLRCIKNVEKNKEYQSFSVTRNYSIKKKIIRHLIIFPNVQFVLIDEKKKIDFYEKVVFHLLFFLFISCSLFVKLNEYLFMH